MENIFVRRIYPIQFNNGKWPINWERVKFQVVSIIGGPWGGPWVEHVPPSKKNFYWLHWGGGTCPPPLFYWIHDYLESLFEKNKQIGKFRKISSKFVQNFLKIFSKFSKISNISFKFCKIFLIFFKNSSLIYIFTLIYLNLKSFISLIAFKWLYCNVFF